ncbi:hypothetical protein [Leifsonia sp. SIMBA_070]|uniref:hypothetical protein n=1 Tax=Leifsonia sp. SIMBA_070 TaxID=3085810 RepID=UPI00397B0BFD
MTAAEAPQAAAAAATGVPAVRAVPAAGVPAAAAAPRPSLIPLGAPAAVCDGDTCALP